MKNKIKNSLITAETGAKSIENKSKDELIGAVTILMLTALCGGWIYTALQSITL